MTKPTGEISSMIKRMPKWASGDWRNNGDMFLGYEVTMARNMAGHKMTTISSVDDNKTVFNAISPLIDLPMRMRTDSLGRIEIAMLFERSLIDDDYRSMQSFSELAYSDDEADSATINEIDHLRIRTFSATDAMDAFERAMDIESRVSSKLNMLSTPVCAIEYGSEAVVSAIISTPATNITGTATLAAMMIPTKGTYCEPLMGDAEASASMMRIARKTRITDVKKTISKLQNTVDIVMGIERRRRADLMENREAVSVIHKSWGLLANSIEISESESLRPMSWWVAGINAGIESNLDVNDIKEAIVRSMTGHLLSPIKDIKCEKQARARQIRKILLGREGVILG